MTNLKFVVCREDKYYVSQCLNVDVSSFGDAIDEAILNLREAVELYFEEGEASTAKTENGCLMPSFVASLHMITMSEHTC